MKALIIAGPKQVKIIETPKPAIGSKDALVKVAFSGICGTDLAIYGGEMSLVKEGLIKYPCRIGHEWSGIVAEVGSDVKKFKAGDRVVSDNVVACGKCKNCLEGNFRLCEHGKSLGTVNCWDGSFAEYVLMPEWHLFHLPDQISLEEAVLIEPSTIALAGFRTFNIKEVKTMLIIGTGPIGLTATILAKAMGVEKVFVSGRKPYKLDVAAKVGADFTINATKENLAEIISKETNGKGVDVIIETSGNITTIQESVDMVKAGGVIELLGFYETTLNNFNIDRFVMKCVKMNGVLGDYELPQQIIDIVVKHKISFKPLITHRFSFDEAPHAIETANEMNDTKIKMVVKVS